jgi:hypothetical protein
LLVAPGASAEPSARFSTFTSCPALAATCTRYWSVARTEEFNNEEKAIVTGAYAGTAATMGVVALITASTGVAAPVAAVAGADGLFSAYKAAEFDTALSSAANDNRCLIFKFPKGIVAAGWWASVSSSTNSQCQTANNKDRDVFK